MGLFDGLKNLKNLVTGGGADLHLEVVEPSIGNPFEVVITAQVGDADLKIAKVYLKVQSQESVEVKDVPLGIEENGQYTKVEQRDLQRTVTVFDQEFAVAGPQSLESNTKYEWRHQIQLGAGHNPTYLGRTARHVWRFYAGLDARGNDPDSGWVEVEIR